MELFMKVISYTWQWHAVMFKLCTPKPRKILEKEKERIVVVFLQLRLLFVSSNFVGKRSSVVLPHVYMNQTTKLFPMLKWVLQMHTTRRWVKKKKFGFGKWIFKPQSSQAALATTTMTLINFDIAKLESERNSVNAKNKTQPKSKW